MNKETGAQLARAKESILKLAAEMDLFADRMKTTAAKAREMVAELNQAELPFRPAGVGEGDLPDADA